MSLMIALGLLVLLHIAGMAYFAAMFLDKFDEDEE